MVRLAKRAALAAAALAACSVASEQPEAGQLTLTWSDCGAAHGHATSISPGTLVLGQTTTVIGKGNVDEDVAGGSYELTFSVPILGKLLDHKGDGCKPDTIALPLGTGTISWKGFACPLKAGPVELEMDITLSASIPSTLAKTSIGLTATGANGDSLLCVSLQTAPASAQVAEEIAGDLALASLALEAAGEPRSQSTQLSLQWTDCGAPHGHTDSITPSTLTLGQPTQVHGKGAVDEDITGGAFEFALSVPILGKVLDHKGDICKAESIPLPLNIGTLGWRGLACPVKAGPVELDMDLTLSSTIPASLARATIALNAAATNGDKLLCLNLKTAPTQSDEVSEALAVFEAENLPEEPAAEAGTCQKRGQCGLAYQACCTIRGKQGHACGCHLSDGTGKTSLTCGVCGLAYKACCVSKGAKGEACACDVHPATVYA